MPPTTTTPMLRVADFFCGCGGTSEGLRLAGMEIALGLDFDGAAAATYRRNFPDAVFFERDICAVDPAEVNKTLGKSDSRLVMSACAPCQPFSTFRKKGPDDDAARTLLPALLPFVDSLTPDYIVVENVPGIQKEADGPLMIFVGGLREREYDVKWRVVDCQRYGVPQRRRRLVLIASLFGQVAIPPPTHGPGLQPVATVSDWIDDLPPLEAGQRHTTVPNHICGAIGELNLRRLRASRELGSRLHWPKELWLDCHQSHGGHSDVYGCMAGDAPAPVLTTKCTSISNGRFGHPSQDRAISVREAASLQTFPRSFEFVGGLKSTTRQVGNAVPVLLAKQLGEAIIEHARARELAAAAT
jgi:DNA (cytosine-5)-methyltransferase 1